MEIACHGKHDREVPAIATFILQHHEGPKLLVHTTMASLYNLSRTPYDDPGGPPPGSPPTCTPFLICLSLSVLLFIFVLSKV